MRASHLALIVAILTLPSAAYSQDSGQVDGKVGPDLNFADATQPFSGVDGTVPSSG
jgi:hypothetical protein